MNITTEEVCYLDMLRYILLTSEYQHYHGKKPKLPTKVRLYSSVNCITVHPSITQKCRVSQLMK